MTETHTPAPPEVQVTRLPLVLDAEDAALVDVLAGRITARLAQGLLRLPAEVHELLQEQAGAGYYLNPVRMGIGPGSFDISLFIRKTGLEMVIRNAVGDRVWAVEFL